MKLQYATAEVISNVQTEKSAFTISANAKSFKILIDGLYSDKILAIVRELSSNAYDAHISAGIADKPFDVKLPSPFNPEFAIRDYGNSMDHQTVMSLYTTIFWSSKDSQDLEVGQFGLGSKSPFAYVDSFIVVTFRNGEKREYHCHIDSANYPTIQHVYTESTDEPNGTLVKLTAHAEDVKKFIAAAKSIYPFYTVLPNIESSETIQQIVPMGSYGVVTFYPSDINSRSKVSLRQGNVLYPFDTGQYGNLCDFFAFAVPSPYSRSHEFFVIDCPIGTFQVTPSRESISYDKQTIESLRSFFSSLKEQYKDELIEKATTFKNYLEKVSYYNSVQKIFSQDFVSDSLKELLVKNGSELELKFLQSQRSSDLFHNIILLPYHEMLRNLERIKAHKAFNPNTSHKIYPEIEYGLLSIVPGYLYYYDETKFKVLTFLPYNNLQNITIISGLERRISNRSARIRSFMSGKTSTYNTYQYYFCYTKDFPRFHRLTGGKCKVMSIEDLPEVEVASSKASFKASDITEVHEAIIVSRGSLSDDAFSYGTYGGIVEKFSKIIKIFIDHNLWFNEEQKQWMTNVRPYALRPSDYQRLSKKKDVPLFGNSLAKHIDLNFLRYIEESIHAVRSYKETSYVFRDNSLDYEYQAVMQKLLKISGLGTVTEAKPIKADSSHMNKAQVDFVTTNAQNFGTGNWYHNPLRVICSFYSDLKTIDFDFSADTSKSNVVILNCDNFEEHISNPFLSMVLDKKRFKDFILNFKDGEDVTE